jgi:membrane protease YdiL (CAAX protease family)
VDPTLPRDGGPTPSPAGEEDVAAPRLPADGAPLPPAALPPAAGPAGPQEPVVPRKSALAFFGAVVVLYAAPGLLSQMASPPFGLLWTEVFCFLMPAVIAAAGSNLVPSRFLRVAPAPRAAAVVLGAIAGATGNVLADGLMALAQLALPHSWVETFDLSRLFAGPAWERIAVAVIATAVAPVCEEVAFRGYVQTSIALRRGPVVAIAAATILFSVLHADPIRFPALLFLGALFGWLAWRAGSVWPSVAAHAANNGIAAGIALAFGAAPAGAAERPTLAGVALAIAVGAGVLAPVLVAYRAVTPRPPPALEAVALRDPARPETRFSVARIPPGLAGLVVLGAVTLAALVTVALLRSAAR